MPTIDQHASFVRNNPYRGWWLIHDSDKTLNVIGSVYVSFDNSVGIDIDVNDISFSAEIFTQILKKEISPLAPVASKIFKDFFYNVSPKNNDLITWLSESGYITSQISLSPK
jgi:hypothetical protein